MLLGACRAKDLTKIKRALEQGGDPWAAGKDRKSAMSMVIDGSQTDILDILLDAQNKWKAMKAFNYAMNANKLAMATFMINRKNCDLQGIGSALFSAPFANAPDRQTLAKLFMKKATPKKLKTEELVDLFFLAARSSDIAGVKLLISKVDVNSSSRYNHSVLCSATNPPVLSFLIDNGANIEAVNSQGTSVLDMALNVSARHPWQHPVDNHDICVQILFQRGARSPLIDINAHHLDCVYVPPHYSQVWNGNSSFTSICLNGNFRTVTELRKRGLGNIDIVGPQGNTCLHRCAFKFDLPACERLIAAGASLVALDLESQTPLDLVGASRDNNPPGPAWSVPPPPLTQTQKDHFRNSLHLARVRFMQVLRDERWQRRANAMLFLVGNGFRPTVAQLAAQRAEQALVDTSAKIAPVSRATKALNYAYLLFAVLGSDGLQRRIVCFL